MSTLPIRSAGSRFGYRANGPSVTRDPPQCQFFARGACRKGDNCTFSHSADNQTAPSDDARPPRAASDSRSTVQCRFFLQGTCSKGNGCSFAHAGLSLEVAALSAPAPVHSVLANDERHSDQVLPAAETDDGVRQFCGALVVFQDGAKVKEISLASDFSAVRIDRLPSDTTVAAVLALATEQGFEVLPTQIKKIPSPESDEASRSSFVIRMNDPSFAKDFCAKAHSTSAFHAVPVTAALPQSSGWCRVDCKKVLLSWYRSVKIVWLNFGSETIARKVNQRFSSGSYKILGREVTSSSPTCSYGGRVYQRGSVFLDAMKTTWTITLTAVPGTANEQDVLRDIPDFSTPRHVEMGEPTYSAKDEEVFATIRSLLDDSGPLEWWEAAHNHEGKRMKAKARFSTDADARSAFSTLNDMPVPFKTKGAIRLTVQLVHSTRVKVSDLIYEAVKEEIAVHETAWKEQHLHFIPYSPVKGQRVLKIEGVESKQVAEAKQTLERVLSGVAAMGDGKLMWTPSFGSNGSAYDKVKKLGSELGVVIIRNVRKRELRLYGSPDRISEAEKRLSELLKEVSSAAYTIFLNPQQFAWACKGGFKAMMTTLSEKVVAFDIASSPKRITVTGSEKEYHEALTMVNMGDTKGSSTAEFDTGDAIGSPTADIDTGENLCATCWTEADDAILTRCKHIYCTECFENLCFSGSSEDKETAVACKGGSGTCDAIFTLGELQENLPSAAFEDLLEASFKQHVRLHPHGLSYCPTPDCKQVYRLSLDTRLFTCPRCITSICTSCQFNHDGTTCAEEKYMRSGGYEALRLEKERLGIKDCPECRTAIEKTQGCDHITCGGCGTHICWNCMMNFKEAKLCYDHMSKTHGGFGM